MVVSLEDYGWTGHLAGLLAELGDSALRPGRVLSSSGGSARVIAGEGELRASLAGRLRVGGPKGAGAPTVGDWVAMRPDEAGSARIEAVLPRRTTISRKVPGKRTGAQVVAANVDVVFVVLGLDGDYSVRRMERMLTTAWDGGARPVVLLNKLDLCDDPAERHAEARLAAPGVPVLMLSCLDRSGADAILEQLPAGETGALIGSSGVGKSTMINLLLRRSAQRTRDVRESDDTGRHTTTHRELFRLPGGGLLIDNPGLREIQLWSDADGLDRAFVDIAELARACRFRDCSHGVEAGCAVVGAVTDGSLDEARLASYRELQKEIRSLELRRDEVAQRERKREWRAIHREMRRMNKRRDR